jgi:hypothetical protein
MTRLPLQRVDIVAGEPAWWLEAFQRHSGFSIEDRVVMVSARVSQGIADGSTPRIPDHWIASQWGLKGTHDAVLVVCRAGESREELRKQIEAVIWPWTVTRA